MAWNGPSRDYARGPIEDEQTERVARDDAFEQSLKSADLALSAGRDLRAQLDRIDATQTATEAGRARLAMTPGVTTGGSVATRSVADSPLMQGASSHFTQFGQDYAYDPMAAAETEGAASGTAANAADRTRYEALQRIPGIKQRDAAKIVYGKTGVLDQPDPTDPNDMHTALARYLREPTRENAALAVQVGAQPGQFPSRFAPVKSAPGGGELPEHPLAPIEGTPEYYEMLQKREDIQTQGVEARQAAAIAARAAAAGGAGAKPMTGRQSVITKNQQADDLMQQYDGDRAAAESSEEARSLGLTGTDLFLAEGRYRKSQAAAAQRIDASGMAATPEAAKAAVPQLRTRRAPTAQQRSWDITNAAIQAKQAAGDPLTDAQKLFLRDHATRPE